MPVNILMVDDDALLRRSLSATLDQNGYRVTTAANAEDALAIMAHDAPDLVLLDIGLPGMDGLEALRQIQKKVDCPVIFLTARRRELEQVLGLELGADDYITKPFNTDVVLARIKAVLRRKKRSHEPPAQKATVEVGDVSIDPAAHSVSVGGRAVELAPREFDLLHALALEAGRVLTADELLARVWGAEYEGETQSVYVHIRRLREKIEADPNRPQRILTVRGVGYKLAI